MNAPETFTAADAARLVKSDPHSPVFKVTGRDSIVIAAGTVANGHRFPIDAAVVMPDEGLIPGSDYGIVVAEGVARAWRVHRIPQGEGCIGGFHFAPGGNALDRAGGDKIPAINPCSLWDLNFRPACPDPRGMALVEADGLKFWCDIYLTGVDHVLCGTSSFGARIADGRDRPIDPATGAAFRCLDWVVATAVITHHDKQLLTQREFEAAAFGVTERSAHSGDPEITKLDAPRTSRFGVMQATGNMWVWGRSNDRVPRASIFGGSWFSGDDAGSRFANVGYLPGVSFGFLGARGRSDHLQLG